MFSKLIQDYVVNERWSHSIPSGKVEMQQKCACSENDTNRQLLSDLAVM